MIQHYYQQILIHDKSFYYSPIIVLNKWMYSVEGIQKVSRQFSHYARIETIVFKHGVNQSYLSNIDYAINVCVCKSQHTLSRNYWVQLLLVYIYFSINLIPEIFMCFHTRRCTHALHPPPTPPPFYSKSPSTK